jgi:hypothetical protein
MKTLLLTLRQYQDGIDIGQQGSPMFLWSQNLETVSLIGRPLKRPVNMCHLSTNRYLSFMPQDTHNPGGEIPLCVHSM